MYNRLNRYIKRNARRDKRNWVNSIANELQVAATIHRTRDLNLAVNKLTNRTFSSGRPLKNDVGELVTSNEHGHQSYSIYNKQKTVKGNSSQKRTSWLLLQQILRRPGLLWISQLNGERLFIMYLLT